MLHFRTRTIFESLSLVAMLAFMSCHGLSSLLGQGIPASRLGNWTPGTAVGVPGGIPMNRTNLLDVTKPPYYADNTGQTDALPGIQKAINDAKAGDVVYLPAGRYMISQRIDIGPKDDITLRGAGPDATFIDARNTGSAAVWVGVDGGWQERRIPVLGSPTRGQTVLRVDSTASLAQLPNGGIGQLCRVTIKNGNDTTVPVVHVSTYERLRIPKFRVVAKTADTITISPALPFDLPLELEPDISVARSQAEFVGIEDLHIDGTNTTSSPLLTFWQAYACWAKNVKITNTTNFLLKIYDSYGVEVRHCDLRDRKLIGQANGAGLILECSTSCLIEDNIIYRIFPHIEVNATAINNVFAYNFCDVSDAGALMGVSIDSNHRPHNCFNLYEGNIAPKFQADGYFGSVSHDTVFRNWFHGTSATSDRYSVCINLNRFTRHYSLVGNMLGRSGYAWVYEGASGANYGERYIYLLGFPNIGNPFYNGGIAQLSQGIVWSDWTLFLSAEFGKGPGPGGYQERDMDVPATTIRLGNWNAKDNGVNSAEALNGINLPASLYRTSKPAWFGTLAWPAFGPDSPNQSYEAIPAGYRFLHGKDPVQSGGASLPSAPSNLQIQN